MNDKKPDIYLKDIDEDSKPPNPLIWILFLIIPIVIGLLISVVRGG